MISLHGARSCYADSERGQKTNSLTQSCNNNLPGKMCPLAQQWHDSYEGNHLSPTRWQETLVCFCELNQGCLWLQSHLPWQGA